MSRRTSSGPALLSEARSLLSRYDTLIARTKRLESNGNGPAAPSMAQVGRHCGKVEFVKWLLLRSHALPMGKIVSCYRMHAEDQTTPEPVLKNRLNSAVQHLRRAGLVTHSHRGYKIA